MSNKPKDENPKKMSALTDDDSTLIKPNLKDDWRNILFLLLLYIMQSIPIGISTVIPILLQSKKTTSYNDQVIKR